MNRIHASRSHRFLRTLSAVLAASTLVAVLTSAAAASDSWPSFRGPFAAGVADGQRLPTTWNPSSGENVAWSVDLPGTGHGSLAIHSGRIYAVTAVTNAETELVLGDDGGPVTDLEREFSWRLYCLDQKTGETLWMRETFAGPPRTSRHAKSSQANATPATDGKRVVALFGSEGMVAFDDAGEELWRKDLGVLDPGLFGSPQVHWGHASSPVIYEDRVFVQVDRHANSFIVAFDLATGRELWKLERQEKPVWATPTIHVGANRTQLLVIGGDFDRGLDPATGEELWRFARDLQVKTPTPFVAGDLVILAGGYRGRELYALPANAQGLISEPTWTSDNGGPYTSTPVAYRDRIYFVRDTGIFNVLDLKTGETLHRRRLDGTYSASLLASDGHILLTSEDGVVRTLSAEPPFEELGAVDMDEPCMATPAIVDQTLFVRCRSKVWAISGSDG
ncbi:MAG: PQQ-binding-like beta-propeller repeat protein [Acidobacteriota bacterium]